MQRALDQTTKRQAIVMNNMANVNVPGFKRKDIDFHVALEGHLADQYQRDLDEKAAQDASDQTSLRLDGNNVDMEKEVMSVHETALHFEALTNITADYFAGLKSAIREGK